MILTNKAKDDFDKFLYDKYDGIVLKEEQEIYWSHYAREVTLWDVFEKLPLNLQQETITQWLDSVGIYIYVEPSIPIGWENPDCFIFRVGTETNRSKFKTRQEATKAAIEKANEIINSIKLK